MPNGRGLVVLRRERNTLLSGQLRRRPLRDALLAVGAKHSKRWAHAVQALKEPPIDEAAGRPDPKGCTRWFVKLLREHPERPPRPVPKLLKEAAELFHMSRNDARDCYRDAQKATDNAKWSLTRRPKKRT
jgi:hypothetical protein